MTRSAIEPYLVTAEQMRQIEGRLFDAGMPVAALMEKVAGRLVDWFIGHFQACFDAQIGRVCVLAGPGHNGADALVMARELHHLGFEVVVCLPISEGKSLTNQHASYARSLGIEVSSSLPADWSAYEAVIDGLFGFGLTRPITGELADVVRGIDAQDALVFSIDLPSGIHTDTGEPLGTAIRADYTACLGLWKRAFMSEGALEYLGECELIDFDIPLSAVEAVLCAVPDVRRLVTSEMLDALFAKRSATLHKYTAGHLLLVAGSRQYAGAALLSGLGAIASGVGMLTIAVPESVRLALLPQLPGALLVGCAETDEGVIAALPETVDLKKYDAIAFGPGLTPTVPGLLNAVLDADCPLLIDADGLNLLAKRSATKTLQQREGQTILTPHLGEFRRLFSSIESSQSKDALPGAMVTQAAVASGAIVLLKGPRSAIASDKKLWFNPHSTSALARGGSGDVLTGLMGGLIAASFKQDPKQDLVPAVASAVWWHSQAALYAAEQRTVLGVDPLHLAQSLNAALRSLV